MKKIIYTFILSITFNICLCQVLCDTTSSDIFYFLENPPTPNLSIKELEKQINTSLDFSLIKNYDSDIFFLKFWVNCKGEDFNYRLYNRKDGKIYEDSISGFQKYLISLFESSLSFEPGFLEINVKGKKVVQNVDFGFVYQMKIMENKIYFETSGGKGKHTKRK